MQIKIDLHKKEKRSTVTKKKLDLPTHDWYDFYLDIIAHKKKTP